MCKSLKGRVHFFVDYVLLKCLDAIKSLIEGKAISIFDKVDVGEMLEKHKRQGAACHSKWTRYVLIPHRFSSNRKTVTLPGSVHNIFLQKSCNKEQ